MQPFTVKHRFANGQLWDGDDVASAPPLETCDKSGPMVFENIGSKQEVSVGRVLFTCVSRVRPSRAVRSRCGCF